MFSYCSDYVEKVGVPQCCTSRWQMCLQHILTITVPYVKGLSNKFQSSGDRFNIKTVLKTKNSVGFSKKNETKERAKRQTTECI